MAKAKRTSQNKEESGFSELAKRFKEHPFIFGGTVILLLFIIIAFVFVPTMPSLQQNGESIVFGYYNGKPITQNKYFNDVWNETARGINPDFLNYNEVERQIWYQAYLATFLRMAVLEEIKASGYSAPPGEIDRQVALHPEFQEDGLFSRVKYNNYGKANQLSLWRKMEEEHTSGKFYNDVLGLKVSSAEKNFIGAMAFPERSFEMVSLPLEAYPESELRAFAAANQDLFKTIHLSWIAMANEKEAIQLLESIQNGTISFEDAALNHSTDFSTNRSGGDMGRLMAYEIFSLLPGEDDRITITSLKRGEYSAVIMVPPNPRNSTDSWVFFRAEENPVMPDNTQEEYLSKVRKYMETFARGRIEDWLVALMEQLLDGAKQQSMGLSEYITSLKDNPILPGSFEALEKAILGSFGPISMDYTKDESANRGLQLFTNTINTGINPELEGAASNENFWRNAFFTPLNTPTTPFTLGNSITVITPVEENIGDKTTIENIANFYSARWGYMYTAMNVNINNSFTTSDKFKGSFDDNFEDNFESFYFKNIFMSTLLNSAAGNDE